MSNLKQQMLEPLKKLYRKLRFYHWARLAKNTGPMPELKGHDKVILIFLPEAGINSYLDTMLLIAGQLRLRGKKVIFIRCFNLFERCIFMDSESLPIEASAQEKKLLCTYCYKSFEKKVIGHGFDYVDLRHFVTQEDFAACKNIVAECADKPFDYSIDGINITGILEYSFFLYLKKATIKNLSPIELKLWQNNFSSLFIAYHGMKRLFSGLGVSHVIMYDQNSMGGITKLLARKMGVRFANVSLVFHKGIDNSRIRIMLQDWINDGMAAINMWGEFKYLPLEPGQVKEVADDLIIKMSQKSTYSYSPSKSSSTDLMADLGLDKTRKTIVAYTSSPDEADSAINTYRKRGLALPNPDDAFKNQLEWLDELIDFAQNSQEFQLVIRFHPRLAPNHREKWGCEAIRDFTEKYNQTYRNVKIIWPQDLVSSYDLAEIADAVTVAWSSMGIFMARLGIPVISGLKLSLPIPGEDFHIFRNTKEGYFTALADAARNPFQPDLLKFSFRWYTMMYLGYSIDVQDVVGKEEGIVTPAKNADFLERTLIDHEDPLSLSLNAIRNHQRPNLAAIEAKTLHEQVCRLIHYFMTNEDTYPGGDMASALSVSGYNVRYEIEGRIYAKYSPMITRLARGLPEHVQKTVHAQLVELL